jgi:hypothetical protein
MSPAKVRHVPVPSTTADREAFAREVTTYFAAATLVAVEAVYARTRAGAPTLVRQLTWLHLRHLDWTLDEIGECFDRDHSTVAVQAALVERKARYDERLQALLADAPRPDERVFTEPALVRLYARLTRLLAEAASVKDEIDLALSPSPEAVPTRVSLAVIA